MVRTDVPLRLIASSFIASFSFFLWAGRDRWRCRRCTSAAAPSVSLSVGWGWIVSTTSRTEQPISMASTASPIRSPAPKPTMPQPRTRCGLRVDDPLGQPFGAADGLGAAAGRPGELGHFDRAALLLGLGFRESCPGDFGIGEDHGGNGLRLEGRRLAGQRLDGRLAFVGRLVGQHRLAGHVADGQDVRIGRAALGIDHDEALSVELNLGVFQPQSGAVGPPADAQQHAAESPHLLRHVALEASLRSSRFLSASAATFVFR